MKWLHRLKHSVARKIQNKADRYIREGLVQIRSGNTQQVEATIIGSQKFLVEILVEGDPVLGFCECAGWDGGAICEHIWAVLVTAETQGYLGRIASQWNPRVEHGLDDLPDPLDDDVDEAPLVPAIPPPKPAPPKLEPWKERFSELRKLTATATSPKLEAERAILYVVDVADCLSAGTLVLHAVVRRLKKNGEWSKAAWNEVWIKDLPSLHEVDRRIVSLLMGNQGSYAYGVASGAPTRYQPLAAATEVLIPLICESGRLFIRRDSDDELKALAWDSGPPWLFRMDMQTDDENKAYRLTGKLLRQDESRALSETLLVVPGLVFFSGSVGRFECGAQNFAWVRILRRDRIITIPLQQRASFIQELIELPAPPPIDLPQDIAIADAHLQDPPHLKIRPAARQWNGQRLECEMSFHYGPIAVPETQTTWAIEDSASGTLIRRDRHSEERFLQRAMELGLKRDGYQTTWELSPKAMPTLVRTLVAEGWRVEAEGKLYRRSGELKVQVASGIDWFELQGSADFEGKTVSLPELLKAVAKGENLIRLDDGSYGLVPEEWLKRYRLVAGLGKSGDDGIRFSRGQAGLLDALLADRAEVTFDEGFGRVRRELEMFTGVHAEAPSPSFKGELRGYQREGLGWLYFLRRFAFGGCLADDMGLGKTIQILALLDSPERRGPVLVVVPRSLVFNWKQETARFAPSLRVLDFTGAGRKDRWQELKDHDLILTTYGTMRRDVLQLKDVRFDTIVLDEAQAIKNADTESAKAARLLSAEHRLALTGTPIENRLADLWSLFEFLNPGLLGSATVFRSQTSGAFSEESATVLAKALRPFILRRTKEQVARELPAKTEQTIYCELEPAQRKLYNELRDHYRAALLGRVEQVGLQKSRMQILEALLRLRQAACHPGLIDNRRCGESSAKLDSLIPQLLELIDEGHKALVFSQFTSLLAIVRSRLDSEKIAYEYLDGRTRDREACVNRFQQDPKCMLFLISLKAGGVGLNLTAAEYVFLLDPWWNPATEAQAIDRTHRIGQARHVFAYRLIARDTVEEKVVELQKSKRDLADAIITADNSILARLDRETLAVLLS